MKCINCREKLNPYLLRQMSIIKYKDVYEVECPTCNQKNSLSREGYLRLREDWVMPTVAPINNKLPSEMNVIFVSLRRCGISWIIRTLNEYHEQMFNDSIIFERENVEIEALKATRNKYPLPHGWNNVYDIDPQRLLDREDKDGNKYDKVVVIQRKKETLMKANQIYWQNEGIWGEHLQKLLKEAINMYDIVYREDIYDPRYIRVYLEDLNNYPTATLNEFMDFLNFPRVGRPPVIDFKPQWFERNWEAISSIYKKGYKFTKRLGRIQEHFQITRDGFLEYLANIEPEVIELKNVLVMGPNHNKRCHFSENIYFAFKELGINVELLGEEQLKVGESYIEDYVSGQLVYPLSKVLTKTEMKPNLIIMDEPRWFFYNDVNIPCFYLQRELKRPPKLYFPDIAFFWHDEVLLYFKNIFARHWAANVPKLRVMDIALIKADLKPVEKTIKKISLLAGRERLQACVDMKELTAMDGLYKTIREIRHMEEIGIPYIHEDDCLTDEQFRVYLAKSEATICYIPSQQYVSRRILEAMACKTLVVMKIENEDQRKILQSMGFEAGNHFLEVKEWEEIVERNKYWGEDTYDSYKDIIENAYNIVMERHTYQKRAEQLIDWYRDWMLRKKGVMIQ